MRGHGFGRQRLLSSSSKTPIYSFLQSSIFVNKKIPLPKPTEASPSSQPLSQLQIESLKSSLSSSLDSNDIDVAWKSFKSLAAKAVPTHRDVFNSLIARLCDSSDTLNLKRAFAAVVHIMEKNPNILNFQTVRNVLISFKNFHSVAAAFALAKCMFKHRFFMPFSMWGDVLVEICLENGSCDAFLPLLIDCCKAAKDEKLDILKPDLSACNAALRGCCFGLESLRGADDVLENMSLLGIRPNELSFGLLGYLYALKGAEHKILEIKNLMIGFGCTDKCLFYGNVISGYIKAGNFDAVCTTILNFLKETQDGETFFAEETYSNIVQGFIHGGNIKGLASLIASAQKLEAPLLVTEKSVGFGIISACVALGLPDRARSVLTEMDARGETVGLGVYLPILRSYCKEGRTAEATQMIMEISNSGHKLDAGSYNMFVDAAMASRDFQSAFTAFRDMRDAGIDDLTSSYLSIMTGLMENCRPELMASFLDELVEDPRIDVKTHDWNSIIHAFIKAGRLEDAKRTFRRMSFLQFKPNEQTYLSLVNGYLQAGRYFSALNLWNEVKSRLSTDNESGSGSMRLDRDLVDAFLFAMVKGGFFDAVMEVVRKSEEIKIFVDKWKHKQVFMETHKKLNISKMRRKNFRKFEALIAFKKWSGFNA